MSLAGSLSLLERCADLLHDDSPRRKQAYKDIKAIREKHGKNVAY